MFFFFFDRLYYIPEVNLAFKNVCLDRMLSDGYFDMSVYISGDINKKDIQSKLNLSKSRYEVLYKLTFPKEEKAVEFWLEHFNNNSQNKVELSVIESEAIVNWVYKVLKNKSEREEFTKELLKQIKEFYEIKNNIVFYHGVVFNEEAVEIHPISSVSELNSFMTSHKTAQTQLFFRGHSNLNYILLPSVMRSKCLKENERDMYLKLIVECPEDFENCHTHLEKLVEMQHYGLPTRLLDITRNPLVALYFACEKDFDSYGEVVLLSADVKAIKYPQSDTVSILASLPLFPYAEQMEFYDMSIDSTINDESFNRRVPRLLQEIRQEKPAFLAEIIKADLLNNFIVYALKNNKRIIKQDGAFILCGLQDKTIPNSLNQFRYKENGKTIILLINDKKRILDELEGLSINHATLFPEIECVSEYIKNKYN